MSDGPPPIVPLVMPFGGMALTSSSTSKAPPALASVTQQSPRWSDALCGGTFDEPEITIVGGLGSNVVITSGDGETWTDIATSGRGLRCYLRDGDTVWLCGEYGTLFRAPRDLSELEPVPLNISGCMYAMAKAEGVIYVGGDAGSMARSVDGATFERVEGFTGSVHKMTFTSRGLLVPTGKGMFVIRGPGARPERLGLDAGANHTCITRSGAMVVVGDGNTVFRSTDHGVTFTPSRVPPFVATKAKSPGQRPSWLGDSQDLNVIAELADGRLVTAGDKGVILYSSDDGISFERLEHAQTGGSIWGIATHGGKAYLAGENRTVLRVG
ncbi:MAG: hypothetical protein ACKV2T_09285 [Kofleriaceae bacterium]